MVDDPVGLRQKVLHEKLEGTRDDYGDGGRYLPHLLVTLHYLLYPGLINTNISNTTQGFVSIFTQTQMDNFTGRNGFSAIRFSLPIYVVRNLRPTYTYVM